MLPTLRMSLFAKTPSLSTQCRIGTKKQRSLTHMCRKALFFVSFWCGTCSLPGLFILSTGVHL